MVLDPVGAGATGFRTATAERLLSEVGFAAVCGNAGEVSTLAGLDAREAVEEAASRLGTSVAATGEVDHVCDGERLFAVKNGHPLWAASSGAAAPPRP